MSKILKSQGQNFGPIGALRFVSRWRWKISHVPPYPRGLRRELRQERVDIAQQHRVGVGQNDDVSIIWRNAQPPVGGSGPVKLVEYIIRYALPGDVEIFAPLVPAANKVEITMVTDGDHQASVAIPVQAAKGKVIKPYERKELFRRRYGNSEFDTPGGWGHAAILTRRSPFDQSTIEGIEHDVHDLLGFGTRAERPHRQSAYLIRQGLGDRAGFEASGVGPTGETGAVVAPDFDAGRRGSRH